MQRHAVGIDLVGCESGRHYAVGDIVRELDFDACSGLRLLERYYMLEGLIGTIVPVGLFIMLGGM